jgi:crotonobetainyl-CoA:carnitine CoA-transferase CaiB-like acyl-CoA transferase
MRDNIRMPLEGIRVIDLTMWWAGPLLTAALADMGAEVVKIESIQRTDPWRGLYNKPGEPYYERASLFHAVNRNKYDITLNLSDVRGVEILKQLVKKSDMVIENYSARVMKNFGIEYNVLKEIKPDLIMISLPGFGMTGPWRDYASYGFTIEQMAGYCNLTGYPGGSPMYVWLLMADPMSGVYGIFAVLAALHHREKTGKGQYIDLSQLEANVSVIGDHILDYVMNRRVPSRMGNAHPFGAPHGCYPCKGEDAWVTIAVFNDEEWKSLCKVMGNPNWASDEKFSDTLSRLKNRNELDKLIAEWTSQHEHYEVMKLLQKAGVAAGAVLTPEEVLNDPQFKARKLFQWLKHPYAGIEPIPRIPVKFSKTLSKIKRSAPCLGQHNKKYFSELLRMTDEEITQLERDRIIGNAPPGRLQV